LGLLSRILYSKNPIVEMGSCFPYPHPLADQILDLVRAAHRVLGISDGPTHTEVIVDKHGRIEIIDLNPRFVGADVLQSINHAFDVKIENQLLNFAIGLETHLPIEANQYACLQYILPPSVKYFEHIDFPRNEEVKFSTQFLLPGTAIKSRDRQIDYLGCYLTVMNTFDEAVHRSRELRTQIKVNKTHEGVY
jgi:biotin carboxylase